MNVPNVQRIILSLEDHLDLAILLCCFFRDHPREVFTVDSLLRQAEVPFGRWSQALTAVDTFQSLGLVSNDETGIRLHHQNSEFWSSLVERLEGAATYRNIMEEKLKRERPKIVVTIPNQESIFSYRLRSDSNLYVRTYMTSEAFQSLAEEAEKRLVIMTPFLDREGAETVKNLFQIASTGIQKHLILRYVNYEDKKFSIRGLDHIASDLQKIGVKIHDFVLSKDNGCLETFHSKVVCKDWDQAYVGSANLTREHSIEMGFLVFGETAKKLTEIIDIILDISKSV